MPLHHPFPAKATASALLTACLTLGLHADPPARPSHAELAEQTRLAAPVAGTANQHRQAAQTTISNNQQRSESVDTDMRPFLAKHQLAPLLAQNTTSTPAATSQPATPAKNPKQTTLRVECDGGLYFDSQKGVLAYLKNIRLTEKRLTLTCSNELKVFLEKKKPKPGKTTDKATKNIGSFGNPSLITATGNVKLRTKDNKGNPYTATAHTASYNIKTGQMILRGSPLRIQQSASQYLQARTPNAYILIKKNGSFITSESGWETRILTRKSSGKPKTNTP